MEFRIMNILVTDPPLKTIFSSSDRERIEKISHNSNLNLQFIQSYTEIKKKIEKKAKKQHQNLETPHSVSDQSLLIIIHMIICSFLPSLNF